VEIVFDHCQSLTITDNIVMTWNDIEADVILLTGSECFVQIYLPGTIIDHKRRNIYHPSTFNRVSKILESRDSLQM